MTKKQKKVLYRIIIAFALLILLEFLPVAGLLKFALYLIPYLVIGYDILRKAVLGILRGQVFDENFLMAVATVGAMLLGVYEELQGGEGEFTEGVAVMLFYQIGELFQAVAVGKSRRNISALMDIRPDYANIEDEAGGLRQVSPDEVAVGTVIVVCPGEKVPIDGTVVEGNSTLNTSALTGESVPREVAAGDDIISGCVNTSGLLKIRTTREFGESTVSKILDLVENSSMKKSRSENFITKFARYYTPAVCYSALALAVLPPVIRMLMGFPAGWSTWIIRALTFLVISCPCALVISIPLSFFGGIGGASTCGILVKGSNYLEALAQTKYVVFDKTGTLTKGVFQVTGIYSALAGSAPGNSPGSVSCDVSGNAPGSAPGSVSGSVSDNATDSVFCNAPCNAPGSVSCSAPDNATDSVFCNAPDSAPDSAGGQEKAADTCYGREASTDDFADDPAARNLLYYAAHAESYSGHPISKSLREAYGEPIDNNRVTDVEEISGHGVTAKVDGHGVVAGNAKLMKKLGLSCAENTGVGTVVHVAVDGTYAGYILISDVVKPHAEEAISALKSSGVRRTIMLTGDAKAVAEHVAGLLGLDEVHSELLPGDKVECVEALLAQRGKKEKLAFVGDGINDAPVLSRADLGIAMGAMGSDAAIEAADIVLMDDNPMKIALAMRISRKCIRIVYENIVFALSVKAICLILGAFGIANMWMAIFADVGVMVIAVLNAIRCLKVKTR